MNSDIKQIVDAINNLHQPIDVFKDYAVPIFSSFLASGLALFAAKMSLDYQESIANEKRKVDESNKWHFMVNEAFMNLVTIKEHYLGKLDSYPIHRISAIPPFFSLGQRIEIVDSYKLAFLAPSLDDHNKGITNNKWSNINLIIALVANYNTVLGIWTERSGLYAQLRSIAIENDNKTYSIRDKNDLISLWGEQDLTKLIDFTEKAIIYTDDLLIETFDFLNNFADHAKTKIKTDKIKKYDKIMKIGDFDEKYLTKSPKADYSNILDLYGMNINEINDYFRGIYTK